MTELRAEPGEPHSCPSCSTTEDPSSDGGLLPSSRGKLKFSLLYHRERCELLVSSLEAWGLPGRGHTRSAVRVRLLQEVPSHIPGLQCVVQEWRSRVVKSCSRPAFGDHFVCSLRDAEVEKSTLKLEVGWGVSSGGRHRGLDLKPLEVSPSLIPLKNKKRGR